MPVADRRSPAGSPTARRARDDRPRARIEGLEQSSLDDLRMLEHGGHVEHFAGGNAALVEESRPFLRRSHRERLLDLSLQFETAALAILAPGETRIGGKLTAADQSAQDLELLLLVRGDVQETLAGAERARGARRHVLVAHGLGFCAGNEPIRNRPAHGHERGFQHGNVDEFPLPRPLAANERRRNGEGGGHAAHRIGDRIADPQWRRLRVAGDAHHPAQPLDDLIVGGIEPQRSVLAEAGDRTVDDVALDRFERGVAEPQPLHHPGTKIFNEDVRGGDQPRECVAALG